MEQAGSPHLISAMTAPIRYAALAIALGTCHPGVAAAASFDGRWAVEVLSEDGECSGIYVLPIEVVHSRIFYIGRAEIDVNGAIDAAGKVRARFFNGAELVDARGELRGEDFGNGSWVSPTDQCAGTWIARKQ